MRYMEDDGLLYIRIEQKYIKDCVRKQKLQFTNYFLIHNWELTDIKYFLHAFSKPQRIHSTFGHPSIKVTMDLLIWASGTKNDRWTEEAIQ